MSFKFDGKILLLSILVGIFILYLVVQTLSKEKVMFSEPVLDCKPIAEKWKCQVAFDLKNQSRRVQKGVVSIRGMGLKDGSWSGSVPIGEEKRVDFSLQGKQTQRIEESLVSQKQPSFIKITFVD
jgi:hypothetical protein